MAPEILLLMDYTEQVDVFSFGMMLCELISRISPNATNFKRVLPGFGVDPVSLPDWFWGHLLLLLEENTFLFSRRKSGQRQMLVSPLR